MSRQGEKARARQRNEALAIQHADTIRRLMDEGASDEVIGLAIGVGGYRVKYIRQRIRLLRCGPESVPTTPFLRQCEEVRRMHRDGKRTSEIASAIGKSVATVRRLYCVMGITRTVRKGIVDGIEDPTGYAKASGWPVRLSLRAVHILNVLWDGPITSKELGKRLRLKQTYVSRLVNDLVREKFVLTTGYQGPEVPPVYILSPLAASMRGRFDD